MNGISEGRIPCPTSGIHCFPSAKESLPNIVIILADDMVAFAPRGLGRTALSDDKTHRTQTRRRFMLLGQTLAGMQVWDVRRCVQMLRELGYDCPIILKGDGEAASLVSLAALYEKVETVSVKNYPKDDKAQPDYLNISRIVTPAQVLGLVRQRSKLNHRK